MPQQIIDITVDIKQAKKKLKGFERVVDRAAKSALIKTAKSAESFTVRSMAANTGLTVKVTHKFIMLNISVGATGLSAVIKPTKRHPNLIEFMSRAQINRALTRKGKKGGRGRPLGKGISSKSWGKSKVYKGAFVGRGKTSGKLLVYTRENAEGKKSGIRALPGASPFAEFQRPDFYDVLKAVSHANFKKNFKRNIKFFMAKEGISVRG